MTSVRTAFQVRISGQGRAGIDRSLWEGHSTGRHEKAPVRLPCSPLAAIQGDPRTLLLLLLLSSYAIEVVGHGVGKMRKERRVVWICELLNGRDDCGG